MSDMMLPRASDCAYLAGNSIEEGIYYPFREPTLLVLIHLNDLSPICGDLRKVEALAEIDEVEDVLLEAGSTESNARFEELGTDPAILANCVGDLVNVGTGGLTNGRQRVYRGDTLG